MSVEHAEPSGGPAAGLFGSFPQIGSPAGMLLASASSRGPRLDGPRDVPGLGLADPFLLSLVLVAVGLAIRLSLRDAPLYEQAKRRGEVARRPLVEVPGYRRNLWLTIGLRMSQNALYVLCTTFALTYLCRAAPPTPAPGSPR